ncbi:hypothetical protein [Psychrobacter sp. K31L]|uniref:capsular polysaccharide export protein, LipB/KpsS family n=1 Tax=Psychrobacter sp. K31L TaxID=2820758 RepID=UPI001B31D30D|nr:hypothetical protein [Psychrobacter sp. K31L]MBP3946183.1 hypothetical protein [Psychrobacter sp. K31L]
MIDKQSKAHQKSELAEYFSKRTQNHWKKKVPTGKDYQFVVHDPYEIFGEDSGFEKLYLVGKNWVEGTDKPIAVAIGCNDWKFGFIADYLDEFRVAFAPRKLTNYKMIGVMQRLSIKPEVIVIWGYNESTFLNRYISYKNIDIWRVEDGFIRSANLGASGATPYSLVFDKSGLYYNSNNPSDVEKILNSHDFNINSNLTEEASKLLQLIIDLKISKYNPPAIFHDTSLKLKKRVLVIGQVDNDASIRYGNPEKWTMEDMVRLAKYEHPDAEILYRPHPEIFKGFQESNFKNTNVELFAEILSPDEHIIELLERVDHVYTITSLTGLEALLRGKTVTVLGKPFYAGWGLTDDRCIFESDRRTRQLTLLELFVGAYLIYPRYIVGVKEQSNDNIYPLFTTIHKIRSEILQLTYQADYKDILDDSLETSIQLNVQHALRNISTCNSKSYQEIFIFFKPYIIDDFVLNYIWSELPQESKQGFLRAILNICDQDIIIEFLYDIKDQIDHLLLSELISNFFPNHKNISLGEVEEFFKEFNALVNEPHSQQKILIEEQNLDESLNESDFKEQNFIEQNYKLSKLLTSQLNFFSSRNDYVQSLVIIKKLIRLTASSTVKINHLNVASRTLYNKFSFNQSLGVSLLSMMVDIDKNNRRALNQFIDNKFIIENYNIPALIDEILLSIKLNPELISKYRVLTGRNSVWFDIIGSSAYLSTDKTISRLMGLIEHGDYIASKKLFLELYNSKNTRPDKLLKVYTDFLHSEGQDIEAINILENYLKFNTSEFIIKQLIRLNIFIGAFDKAEEYINYCINIGMELNSTFSMPVLQQRGRIGEAYACYINENFTNDIGFLLGNKFREANNISDIGAKDNSLILAVYGPGDEIRFMSIYNDFEQAYLSKAFTISCDYRLYNILCRSFKNIDFLPIRRTRGFNKNYPVCDYDRLPSTTLTTILDNSAFDKIVDYDKVYLVTDFVGKFRESYSDFTGKKYLYADVDLIDKYKQRLQSYKTSGKKLVGLNWRSSLTNFTRMEHYLDIEQLQPLFTNDNIQFVNLQYDDCTEELVWLERKFPGKMINFSDIDQYDDLDDVAALMMCLDLVIAPATTVAELAGALGVNTWLFSNSSQILWRKIDDKATDVWHNSMTIVDVPDKGDKNVLVSELTMRLNNFGFSDE